MLFGVPKREILRALRGRWIWRGQGADRVTVDPLVEPWVYRDEMVAGGMDPRTVDQLIADCLTSRFAEEWNLEPGVARKHVSNTDDARTSIQIHEEQLQDEENRRVNWLPEEPGAVGGEYLAEEWEVHPDDPAVEAERRRFAEVMRMYERQEAAARARANQVAQDVSAVAETNEVAQVVAAEAVAGEVMLDSQERTAASEVVPAAEPVATPSRVVPRTVPGSPNRRSQVQAPRGRQNWWRTCLNCHQNTHLRHECPHSDNRPCAWCWALGHLGNSCPHNGRLRPSIAERMENLGRAVSELRRRKEAGTANDDDIEAAQRMRYSR